MDLDPIYHFTTAKGKTIGPVSRVDLETAIRSPDWYAEALIWRQGWVNWLDWRDAARQIGIPVPTGAMPHHSGASNSPSGSGNFYSPPTARLHEGDPNGPGAYDIVPASFLKRFAAWFIDQVVLVGLVMLIAATVAIIAAATKPDFGNSDNAALMFTVGYYGASILLYVAYYAVFDSSASGATLGKKALGIRVTDLDGRRIGIGRSIARTLSCGLSYLIVYIGFLMALMTNRSQALHDLIARTLVIEKNPEAARKGNSTTVVIVVGAIVVFGFVFVLLPIVAAIALPAYQDYTRRASVDQAIKETEPLRQSIHMYRTTSGECPEHNTEEFGPPWSYTGTFHRQVHIESDAREGEESWCRIRIIMGGGEQNAADGSLLLHMAPNGTITCENETITPKYLPRLCRGG